MTASCSSVTPKRENGRPRHSTYSIADLGKLRVEAEIAEFDTPHVRLGTKAKIRAEGHEGRVFEAIVEEIPDQVVGRALKPLDPARPVDTRVLLVKLSLADATGLKLGQRVGVELPRQPGRAPSLAGREITALQLRVARRALSQLGYDVVTASSGEAGLAAFAAATPALAGQVS